jgi:diadenosine tetraphosphatase ApaH/serine/threonine PP2A family protein phosphatase
LRDAAESLVLALISDVHGNLEALEVVLADIAQRGISQILALGDVIGYGPDPAACVTRVFSCCEVVLRGNHEEALFTGVVAFGDAARAALDHARQQLAPHWYSWLAARRRWERLHSLPLAHQRGDDLFVHGSPRDPLNEYLLPRDCQHERAKLRDVFQRIDGLCFHGHTHVPGIIDERLQWCAAAECGAAYEVPLGHKALISLGSVGQPRDGDPRAAYVVYDGKRRIEFVRLSYPLERTAAKLRAFVWGSSLAERLERGC